MATDSQERLRFCNATQSDKGGDRGADNGLGQGPPGHREERQAPRALRPRMHHGHEAGRVAGAQVGLRVICTKSEA